jgi:hypothetical protein
VVNASGTGERSVSSSHDAGAGRGHRVAGNLPVEHGADQAADPEGEVVGRDGGVRRGQRRRRAVQRHPRIRFRARGSGGPEEGAHEGAEVHGIVVAPEPGRRLRGPQPEQQGVGRHGGAQPTGIVEQGAVEAERPFEVHVPGQARIEVRVEGTDAREDRAEDAGPGEVERAADVLDTGVAGFEDAAPVASEPAGPIGGVRRRPRPRGTPR